MPYPAEYQRASDDFQNFLTKLKAPANLGSSHQVYTMVQGVLLSFRCRLAPNQILEFAGLLPAVLRAIFVADWQEEPLEAGGNPAQWKKEIQGLRASHNFAPDDARVLTTQALRVLMEAGRLDAILKKIGPWAVEFWS